MNNMQIFIISLIGVLVFMYVMIVVSNTFFHTGVSFGGNLGLMPKF